MGWRQIPKPGYAHPFLFLIPFIPLILQLLYFTWGEFCFLMCNTEIEKDVRKRGKERKVRLFSNVSTAQQVTFYRVEIELIHVMSSFI